MLVTPNPFVIEYAPWSSSMADTASQCPYRFYRQYVKRDKAPSNADALVGQTVHKVLEYVLGEMPIRRAFELSMQQYSLTTPEIERVVGFQPQVQNFYKKFKFYRNKHQAASPKLEQRIGVTLEGKLAKFFSDDVFFRGVLDISMLFNGKPHALILDHKTGRRHSLTYYTKQFDAYKWLLKAQCPTLEEVQLAVNFVAEDAVDFVKGLQDVKNDESLRNKVVTNLNKATENTSDFKLTCRSPLCGWCGYKDMGCPAYNG